MGSFGKCAISAHKRPTSQYSLVYYAHSNTLQCSISMYADWEKEGEPIFLSFSSIHGLLSPFFFENAGYIRLASTPEEFQFSSSPVPPAEKAFLVPKVKGKRPSKAHFIRRAHYCTVLYRIVNTVQVHDLRWWQATQRRSHRNLKEGFNI